MTHHHAQRSGAVTAHTVAVLLAALGLAGAVPASALQPVGLEVLLDPGPECGGAAPDLAPLAGGGHVAVWPSYTGVCARRLAASGAMLGTPEVLAGGTPTVVAVAADTAGGFAVAWHDGPSSRLLLKRVDASGASSSEQDVAMAGSSGGDPPGLDLVAGAEGDLFVVWTEGPRVLSRRFPPQGAPEPIELVDDYSAGGSHLRLHDPVAVLTSQRRLVVWTVGTSSSREGPIHGRWRDLTDPLGLPAPGRFVVSAHGRHAALAAVRAPGVLIVWTESAHSNDLPPVDEVLLRLFDLNGTPLALARVLHTEVWTRLDHAVAASDGQRVAVAWDAAPMGDGVPAPPRLQLRQADLAGIELGPVVGTPAESHWGQTAPALALNGQHAMAAWQAVENPMIGAPASPFANLRARPFAPSCGTTSPGTLCLDGGRFALTLTWTDPRRGIGGEGSAVALTNDSGYFWFFSPDNAEVVAKVLDGTALNGHFWVFYGSLTDLGFTLTVTDTVTGRQRSFVSPAGSMASHADTSALPAGPGLALPEGPAELRALSSFALVRDALPADLAPGAVSAPPSRLAAPDSAAGPCSPPELPVVPRPGLCLTGRRFEVEATWRDFDGGAGVGQGVSLGDDAGYFWFFDRDNVEVVLKVLDGRAVNGRFWVFYGALSSVAYDLEVRHVLGDATRRYHNAAGTLASVGDVEAFLAPGGCGCPAVYEPVCGTDGRTYGNACDAYCTGWVPVAHDGPCAGDP